MASRLDDRYLWLGFGIFFVAAAYGIRYAIRDIVDLTRIDPIEPLKSDVHEGQPEDCRPDSSTAPSPH